MPDPASRALVAYRRPMVVATHLILWTAAFYAAFLMRFDFTIPSRYYALGFTGWLLPLLLLRVLAFTHYGLFRGMWKYAGERDLIDIAKATVATTLIFSVVLLFAGQTTFPRSVVIAELILSIIFAGGIRFATRTFAQATRKVHESAARRMLVVGAGDAGEALVREIHRSMRGRVEPIGFLDDAPEKAHMSIHGIRVLGPLSKIREVVEEHAVAEVAIALPASSGRDIRALIEQLSGLGIQVRTIPGLDHLVDGQVTVNQLRDVAIEDLLGRAPVELETDVLMEMLRNEVVLVTGAGGSIGSELCRQVLQYQPRRLVLVEQAENALYEIHRELSRSTSVNVVPRIVDITDHARLDSIFERFKPGVVLHAAAHKHVPMMEWNPTEAVKNNIGGTRNVADAAHRHGVRRFVMISTDKAVNPTSVMGCTKRVAELYVQAQAQRSETTFATVRFGNVLGSNGSVIPLFRDQIARGGPVTVTHPEMERYFMTIPEASQLVLQSAAMAQSGDVFILDMGEPVKIVTLAEDLIRLSGLQPGRDISIEFVGMRPGEKLFEELSADAEGADKTRHPKIYVGRGEPRPIAEISSSIDQLMANLDARRPHEVRGELRAIVPEFQSPEDVGKPDTSSKVVPFK